MVERKKVGLLFVYDESWAGGFYYLLNIIHALSHLPDSLKPELTIFYNTVQAKDKLTGIGYPYLHFLPLQRRLTIPERIMIKCIRLFKSSYKYRSQYPADTVDFAFPCDYNAHVLLGSLKKIRIIYWIPDFQHKHLPHFFSQEEIQKRDTNIQQIADRKVKIVLSSEDAKQDFVRFYHPGNAETVVMPFASILPVYDDISAQALNEKYSIDRPYFMSPNQFWVHKNHIVILKAVKELKHKGYSYKILFTGKEFDYRNPDYVPSLKRYIQENQIGEYVEFLGFIDRREQLKLMSLSTAIIQPSLFEGWSTVVEDTKAMNKPLILSSLRVHYEQCGDNALYFDPQNEHELATQIEKCLLQKTEFPFTAYDDKILAYAKRVIDL